MAWWQQYNIYMHDAVPGVINYSSYLHVTFSLKLLGHCIKNYRAVHFRAALTHLQCLVHPFLLSQWINLWYAQDVSGIYCHTVFHIMVPNPNQHHFFSFAGSGSSYIRISAFFQQVDWCIARLMCCFCASWVGGRFSRLLDFRVNNTIINTYAWCH